MALGRPAHADRPGPFSSRFDLPIDLVPPRAIKSLDAKSHKKSIHHPPPQDGEQEADWIGREHSWPTSTSEDSTP
jgi:hypothetical protein